MTKGKYLRQHKMKHYNLCWLEGEDPIVRSFEFIRLTVFSMLKHISFSSSMVWYGYEYKIC